MQTPIQTLCGQMADYRELIKRAFRWESDAFYPVCANLFCACGVEPDEGRLLDCRDLIRQETGLFSNFRGNVRLPLICLLSMEDDPEESFRRVLDSYRVLKRRFFASDYLALAAYFLSDLGEEELGMTVGRARSLYERMKREHPLLTGSEDSVFAVLLARSERDDTALIDDMEECYVLLKERFRDSDSMQTVSHALALDPREPRQKTACVTGLYDAVTDRGVRYSRHRELGVLASLALADAETDDLAEEVREAFDCLADHRGWHGLLGYDRRTRAMHAAMLAGNLHTTVNLTAQTALSGTLTVVLAQQMAVLAAVSASSAAAAASSSSH